MAPLPTKSFLEGILSVPTMKASITASKIEMWVSYILQKLVKGKFVLTEEMRLHNSMVLIRVFILLDKTHAHLVEGSYVNQRALFYELRHLQMDCSVPRTSSNYINCSYLFPSQVQVDATIRKISHMLGSTRNELHIYPNGKGFLSGAIAFEQSDASFHIDCLREFPDGWSIPGTLEYLKRLSFKNLGAQYIIVVEKHGIFKRLLEDRFVHFLPCILICGQGYPSIATKFLFQRLARELRLPCLGLVDYNPHGLALLKTYRNPVVKETTDLENDLQGSWLEDTPIKIYWLGLHFSQLSELNLWDKFRKPLTRRDQILLEKLRNQLQREDERSQTTLEEELRAMQNGKVELQAVFSLGNSYLSRTYLPFAIFHFHELVPYL